ncbi:hypothetical protein HPP92_028642 [Vanilla planifolia]|uniref:Molybdopterin cofactor biosynthesis C (MoaC) domain-containing protein n=1 Tax=Vanilla planifolia TaxID=51239 RepID=A0A835P6Y9_VANPL|nr:hypothetical protein HPP92_028642 [Vanilla planifolia]KAG0446869.1 hypothetical protein HPP92_028636 [Vanilla planifolia]
MARVLLGRNRSWFSARRSFSSCSNYEHAIADLNKEMESIFGEPPSAVGMDAPSNKQRLSHVDQSGKASMVDVSSKEDSKRTAVASCRVLLGRQAFDLLAFNPRRQRRRSDCGEDRRDPWCQADEQPNPSDCSVEIQGEAATVGKTGVEMEAMTAVAVAGLTVYDMCKAATKDIRILDVRLEGKTGGKSGGWTRKLSTMSDDDDGA